MVVNTLRNPDLACTRAGAARTLATHYIILRGVVYAKCTNFSGA